MRYAVTGATGFVGGALARLLGTEGHEVVALVRSADGAARLAHQGYGIVRGGLDDAEALGRLLEGADGLFHVAGWYRLGVEDDAEAVRANVDGTRAVLTAAAEAGTARCVYTSTLAVNSDTRGAVRDESFAYTGPHLSVYDRTKAQAHRVALAMAADGLPLVVVMPGLVYGPGDTSQTGALLAAVLRGERVLVPRTGRVCWAHVDDVARGHLLAMERGRLGETYMLAGPAHGLAEALTVAAHEGGGRPPTSVPGALVRLLAAGSSAVRRVASLPATYRAESLRAALATYLGTAEKARRDLGWEPRPLAVGMAETVRDLLTQD